MAQTLRRRGTKFGWREGKGKSITKKRSKTPASGIYPGGEITNWLSDDRMRNIAVRARVRVGKTI